jgi:hypothetical protein
MKRSFLAAVMGMGLWAALCGAQGDMDSSGFVVVKVTNHDKSEMHIVMTTAELRALKAEIETEWLLFDRALSAAASKWKEDNSLSRYPFPSPSLVARQAIAVGPLYDSQEKASAALNALLNGKDPIESRPQPPGLEREGDTLLALAVDLLAGQLDDMKAAWESVGGTATAAPKIALVPGEVLGRTTLGASRTTYHIAVPDGFSTLKPPPLLVVFSPGGDGRDMVNRMRASANRLGWMVIGCDRLRNGMDIREVLPIERDLMRDLRAFIPYDRTRLYYGGFSGGACRAYRMTWRFRDRCAGILAFGGWLGGSKAQKSPFQQGMAIAMVNGDSDTGVRKWEESDTDVLVRLQCKVRVFHFPGGHAVAPRQVIDEAIAWLDTQGSQNRTAWPR